LIKNLNLANFLSILRLLSGIPLIIFLNRMSLSSIYVNYTIYIILFIVISDVLDGFLARRFNTVTSFGKVIDPVADKICLMSVLIYLIDIYHLPFLIFFILLSIRDIVLISMTAYLAIFHDTVTQANNYGKLFIFITMLMIIFHIFDINSYASDILFISSIILLIFSMFVYIKEHLQKITSYENI